MSRRTVSRVIPHTEEKYDAAAVFTPTDALDVHGDGTPEVPSTVVLGFQSTTTEVARARADDPIPLAGTQEVLPVADDVGYVPIHEQGIGAPVAAIVTENVLAAGAEAVVSLGGCAGIDPSIPPDAAILPTETIRDEGVSYHYLPADEPVRATPELVDALDDSLSEAGFETPRGRTWTTSAMYRETVPEVERYRESGVVSSCMESAAVWAVCAYRGADAATVHWIGDYLTPDEWVPDTADASGRSMGELFDPVVRALDTDDARAVSSTPFDPAGSLFSSAVVVDSRPWPCRLSRRSARRDAGPLGKPSAHSVRTQPTRQAEGTPRRTRDDDGDDGRLVQTRPPSSRPRAARGPRGGRVAGSSERVERRGEPAGRSDERVERDGRRVERDGERSERRDERVG